jgi:hypothetical protein
MTIQELQHRFNLEVAKYGIIDPVMSTIVEDYLNWAYQQYITEKYDSIIDPREKFEVTERISRILAPLLKPFTATTFISTTTLSDYGYYCVAPLDLQYIVSERAVLNITDCNGQQVTQGVSIIPIKHNMVSVNEANPFLKPFLDEIWRLNSYGNRLDLIIPPNTTLSSYTCKYIKKQRQIYFNPPDESGISCTMTMVVNTVTKANHGLLNDNRVMFSGSGLPTELTAGVLYFVVTATTNTFQVSKTYGGSIITFAADGSGYYHVNPGEMEIDSSVHEEIAVRAAYNYLGNLGQNNQKQEKTQDNGK